jgi:hypothetical protein
MNASDLRVGRVQSCLAAPPMSVRDLDNARAKGVHRHPADSQPGDPGSTWMHVSAGLGTSPHVRLRLACRPEASLVTLTARPA